MDVCSTIADPAVMRHLAPYLSVRDRLHEQTVHLFRLAQDEGLAAIIEVPTRGRSLGYAKMSANSACREPTRSFRNQCWAHDNRNEIVIEQVCYIQTPTAPEPVACARLSSTRPGPSRPVRPDPLRPVHVDCVGEAFAHEACS